MAKMTVKGLEDYGNRLEKLCKNTEDICKAVVYAGADVIADAIKEGIKSLPTDDGIGTEKKRLKGITNKQKADLINGLGIAAIENKEGEINTKVGFAGYGSVKTKKYPKGIPNAMLMRAVESGTSFRQKTPVVRKAVNTHRKEALKVMEKETDKQCEKMMN